MGTYSFEKRPSLSREKMTQTNKQQTNKQTSKSVLILK